MSSSPCVTLLSDFGCQDSYVGIMKGQILRFCPQARLVDLSHQIPPQDVRAAGFQLDQAVDFFPPDTVHLAVVDPGVGTSRAMLAVALEQAFFVAPDNGLLSRILARLGPPKEMVKLDVPELTSCTFHGRDVMAPAAGRIASGAPLSSLGVAWPCYQKLECYPVLAGPDWIELGVLAVDHFGNICFDFPRAAGFKLFSAGSSFTLGGYELKMASTYADVEAGQALLLWSSAGMLELACRQASASFKFGLYAGSRIRLYKAQDQVL